jgi:hypothetical protein
MQPTEKQLRDARLLDQSFSMTCCAISLRTDLCRFEVLSPVTHVPGRGHRRKSDPQSKERIRKKHTKKKYQKQKTYELAIERWNRLSADARKLRPEFPPDNFKP